jgi:hypothetical protein
MSRGIISSRGDKIVCGSPTHSYQHSIRERLNIEEALIRIVMTSTTATRASGSCEVRHVGRVTDAEELLRLPECELVDAEGAEVSGDGSTLTFHCLSGKDKCGFQVMAIAVGKQFAVFVRGEHSHGKVAGVEKGAQNEYGENLVEVKQRCQLH